MRGISANTENNAFMTLGHVRDMQRHNKNLKLAICKCVHRCYTALCIVVNREVK